jgi:hypothetical protein
MADTSPEPDTSAVIRGDDVDTAPSVEDTLTEPVASTIDVDTEASDESPAVKSETPAVKSETPAASADSASEKRSSDRGTRRTARD